MVAREDLNAAMSEIANTNQELIGLVDRLRATLGAASADVARLEGSIVRTVKALRTLQSKEGV
jgi:hypothetical protein